MRLLPRPGLSPFVSFAEPIELPVAHGEGEFLTAEPATSTGSNGNGQIVLQYGDDRTADAGVSRQSQRLGPRRSPALCDPTGRIFGLMPHPERFVDPWHHPRWTRRPDPPPEGDGLRISKRHRLAAVIRRLHDPAR